jgi:hypothetical protein
MTLPPSIERQARLAEALASAQEIEPSGLAADWVSDLRPCYRQRTDTTTSRCSWFE